MMKKITKEIREALNALIEEWGSALEVERRLGITNSTISKYRSGKIPKMSQITWNTLEPHLRAYLPPEDKKEPSAGDPAPDFLQTAIRKVILTVASDDEFSDAERGKFIRILSRKFHLPEPK